MDMSQYLDIFIEESKEHLQGMNEILLKLEDTPEDKSLLNEIFRVAHTLKGMSGTMGFNNILNLTHQMENVLDELRNGKMEISSNVIDIIFECFDQLELYITQIENDMTEGNISSDTLIKKLELLLTKDNSGKKDIEVNSESSIQKNRQEIQVGEYVGNVIETAIDKKLNCYKLKISLDEKCMLKSARAYIIINSIEKIAEIVDSNPSIEDIEDEKFDLSFEIILITEHDKEDITKELTTISDIESIEFTVLKKDNITSNANKNDDQSSLKEEITSSNSSSQVEQPTENKNKKAKTNKTVRVDIDRLDNLMNLVSELIIIKTRLEDIDGSVSEDKQSMNEATEQLERITTSLHDAVMKVRMVPIERVFNRFPRMVRDLSKDLGKEISLIMSGAETEVDRTVIDEIGDPLIHLIRNSIDHGIEETEQRIKLNKDKTGTVKLTAYPDGNSVVIEVEDDGKGIDIEKVKTKALNNNVISIQQSQMMDDSQIIQLLFAPGFSTADKISDISGRGVGLDVVKTKIESLGGTVEVESIEGKGSKFIIRLPLTLAIIQALLVVVGEEKYAIPLNNIKEITTIHPEKIRRIQGNEVVLFRNTTLPILRLSKLLDVTDTNTEESEHSIVIVKKGDKTAGILVDRLIGQQEIVIKSLGKFLANINGIAGATILGNGSVALIVDTNSFF
ncbi:chemotaxis protein CheA [Serpentinicella sp. ANB-PHB4]|uniref:chemotaxis protein CheA n=1 Tax=Serpentinicella sp. ANB-PHB4 TaxID=3074076 RepID=UPI002856D8BC|nr:chemotaxis protein CheA [Serpentinicella sp. ANB-PHB4]MDR5658245.1 chemotaxis protein CheA [Serpentinicella sp. ANB-PHB4]